MWILDSSSGKHVELWVKDNGLKKICRNYSPPFLVHLPERHSATELMESLATKYRVEECCFRTIYGSLEGFAVYAPPAVAHLVEKHTKYRAELFNVDVRKDQRFLAESGYSMCTNSGESRFSWNFDVPLEILEMRIVGDPRRKVIHHVEIGDGEIVRLYGREKKLLSDLSSLLKSIDPDVILLPSADSWMLVLLEKGHVYDIDISISRNGRYRTRLPKSYWSYGRIHYRGGSVIPEGRILIDTENSFTYVEGGLHGVIAAARLTGLAPNLVSRVTPGTLISSYEIYEALRRGIAVPLRKSDPERLRRFKDLRTMDKGGMIFQPEAGIYEMVYQLDFTSLYPSIIVKYNLSPETLHGSGKGFLPTVLEPLLRMRIATKRRKLFDQKCAWLDPVLKWMLVTCFGYTGYRNAKFGSIEVHERITRTAREILIQVKEIAESMGLEVVHGLVDCLWVCGEDVENFRERIETETGIPVEVEPYDWIVFLPLKDGGGAYNRYFGRLSDGRMRVRGVMMRRGDTPPYVQKMQEEMFRRMAGVKDAGKLLDMQGEIRAIYYQYMESLPETVPDELRIQKRIGRSSYARRCLEAAAVAEISKEGLRAVPGMEMEYVVVDARHRCVDVCSNYSTFDVEFYKKLLTRAWEEVEFTFRSLELRSSS